MSKRIVSQIESQVKCVAEECHEDIFRAGLCFDHFVDEEIAVWDDWDAERQATLENVGYIFSDPALEGMGYIFSDPMEEVYR